LRGRPWVWIRIPDPPIVFKFLKSFVASASVCEEGLPRICTGSTVVPRSARPGRRNIDRYGQLADKSSDLVERKPISGGRPDSNRPFDGTGRRSINDSELIVQIA